MKPTLDSIASAKAKLADEIRVLEQQEAALRKEQAADAFTQVMSVLHLFDKPDETWDDPSMDAIYVSPMKRAQQTLGPMTAHSRSAPKVLPGLREVAVSSMTDPSAEMSPGYRSQSLSPVNAKRLSSVSVRWSVMENVWK